MRLHSPFVRASRVAAALIPLLLSLAASCAAPSARDLAHQHTLVYLKSGERAGTLDKVSQGAMFLGHMKNIQTLAEERKLLVAGPFGQPKSDASLRGVFVFATADEAEARALGEADPGVKAGEFRLELHAFATDTDLRPQLERLLAQQAEQRAQGKTPMPSDVIRPYMLLVVEDGDAAWSGLSDLAERGTIVLLGRLDGTHALAVVDAQDRAAAETVLAPVAMQLGVHTLEPWYAAKELANRDAAAAAAR